MNFHSITPVKPRKTAAVLGSVLLATLVVFSQVDIMAKVLWLAFGMVFGTWSFVAAWLMFDATWVGRVAILSALFYWAWQMRNFFELEWTTPRTGAISLIWLVSIGFIAMSFAEAKSARDLIGLSEHYNMSTAAFRLPTSPGGA